MADNKGDDPTWSLMLFIGMLIVAGALIWWFWKAEILTGLRYLRMGELWLIGLFDQQASACFKWLRVAQVPTSDMMLPSQAAYQAALGCFGPEVRSLPPAEALAYYNITATSTGFVTNVAERYIRWPVALVCVGLGIHALFFTVRNKFKTRHNLESFIKIQAKIWPVISPIVNFSPADHSARIPGQPIPAKLPPFAEALSPEEWIAYHAIPVANRIPDRESVRRAFVAQLGPRWEGPESLPPHIKALYAAFALKGVQRREECDELLGRLAQSWSLRGGFIMDSKLAAEVDQLVRDPNVGGKALPIAGQHAYRTTALLAVLRWARFMGGVLAPAQFLWVRAADRALWYPLNNLGRRTFHTEGAGAMAHFLAEQAANKPLIVPRVDTAIVTLNQYLAANTVAIPPRNEGTAAAKA